MNSIEDLDKILLSDNPLGRVLAGKDVAFLEQLGPVSVENALGVKVNALDGGDDLLRAVLLGEGLCFLDHLM